MDQWLHATVGSDSSRAVLDRVNIAWKRNGVSFLVQNQVYGVLVYIQGITNGHMVLLHGALENILIGVVIVMPNLILMVICLVSDPFTHFYCTLINDCNVLHIVWDIVYIWDIVVYESLKFSHDMW